MHPNPIYRDAPTDQSLAFAAERGCDAPCGPPTPSPTLFGSGGDVRGGGGTAAFRDDGCELPFAALLE